MARIIQPDVNPELELRILHDLEPKAEAAYDRHMSTGPRKGADFDDISAGTLNPTEELFRAAGLPVEEHVTPELVDAVRTSFDEFVVAKFEDNNVDARPVISRTGSLNQTTESGLEHFYNVQEKLYSGFPVFLTGLRRWTTEEKFHEPLIRDWGNYSGAIKQKKVHADIASMVMNGIKVPTQSVVPIKAFTHPQEFLTGDAHTIFASILDPVGSKPMRRVGGQEFRHGAWFGSDGESMYETDDPEVLEYMLTWEAYLQSHFGMPAYGSYEDFAQDALMNSVCGMFTNDMVNQRQVERINGLGLLDIPVKTDRAKLAQEVLEQVVDIQKNRLYLRAKRAVEEAREKYIADEKAVGRVPFILGQTIIVDKGEISILPDAV